MRFGPGAAGASAGEPTGEKGWMVTQSQTLGRDTSRLVRDAQAGDKDAVDELVTTHLGLIYNIIGRALDEGTLRWDDPSGQSHVARVPSP